MTSERGRNHLPWSFLSETHVGECLDELKCAENVLCFYLADHLSEWFPQEFDRPASVTCARWQGNSSKVFESITRAWLRVVIKIRKERPLEERGGRRGFNKHPFEKEAVLQPLIRSAGLPVPDVLGVAHIPPIDLLTNKTPFGSPPNLSSYAVMLQEAIFGAQFGAVIGHGETTLRAAQELGALVRCLHGLKVDQFSGLFDPGDHTSQFVWSDYVRLLRMHRKAQYLAERFRMFSSRDLSVIGALEEHILKILPDQSLLHCDLSPANVLVDPHTGAIQAVLDWGGALPGPVVLEMARFQAKWCLSFGLPLGKFHQMQKRFLKGYGFDQYELESTEMAYTAFLIEQMLTILYQVYGRHKHTYPISQSHVQAQERASEGRWIRAALRSEASLRQYLARYLP